jgi:hypothetical protein
MKRYDMEVKPYRSYYGDAAFIPVPYESVQGDWVRQEDVEALQALNAEMLEVLKQIAKWHDYEVSTHELCMRMYWSSRLAYDAIAKAEGSQP